MERIFPSLGWESAAGLEAGLKLRAAGRLTVGAGAGGGGVGPESERTCSSVLHP